MPSAVVQREASLDALVGRAVEGDVYVEGSAKRLVVVDTDDAKGRSFGIGDALELLKRYPLPVT